MVRTLRRLWYCGLFVALCVSMATQAAAYSAYDGTISSTLITYYRDMLSKISVFDDYVVFRSDANVYVMAYGDLSSNGNSFTGKDVTVVTISTSGNYNANYVINTSHSSNFQLDTRNNIVYSSLGSFPALEGRSDVIEFAALFVWLAVSLCALLRGIFSWTCRTRSR